MKAWMQTYTGNRVTFPPDPYTVSLWDIAHALSRINRYGGHTQEPYTVAQHSLALAQYAARKDASPELCLALLMHDAAEAYVGDLPRPLKYQLPDYLEMEKAVEGVIWQVFGLTDIMQECKEDIKELDTRIIKDEARLLRMDTDGWGLDSALSLGLEPGDFFLYATPGQVADAFKQNVLYYIAFTRRPVYRSALGRENT